MHERRVRLDLSSALSLIHKPFFGSFANWPISGDELREPEHVVCLQAAPTSRSVSYLHDLGKPLLPRPTGLRAGEA